ncbi:hypothetical protein FVO59_06695 [Microbacterium esteraromaticum]|uniref:Uncharacterized protein n=1 Tax=Microbacterium esteraromaticum TaxID=57043 RepID=A0A7D8AJ76_9MICO|nr:hypothetical protein [Microbacterium esteraromaticum]QMU96946.1 hypothetical protein FVO59_06695 [Microbacterium esteraromaticum]
MTGLALKTVIIVVVIALIVIVIARMFHRPAPGKSLSKGAPAQRMPLLVWLGAAVLLAAGFFLALVSFTSRYTEDLLPMRIAAVVALLAGGAVLFFASRRARKR